MYRITFCYYKNKQTLHSFFSDYLPTALFLYLFKAPEESDLYFKALCSYIVELVC